jgi:hypothetical protein
MKVSLKHLYCYFKKLFGSRDKDDYWDNNPFVIL